MLHSVRAGYCHSLIAILALLGAAVVVAEAPERQMSELVLPKGFSISVYAEGVDNARSMAQGPEGVVFVGTDAMTSSARRAGKVYAVVDSDGDAKVDQVLTVAEGLRMPSGVAWREGSLYVAAISRILRYDDLASRLENPPEPVVLSATFPSAGHHGWKFIRFGPDGKLYVPVGAPCNICEVEDPYAAILRLEPDGTGLEVFARGIRNTVGFDWHPETGALWFTENGRDMMGDDVPPDELNRAAEPGMHFGYPFCHGDGVPDPKFGSEEGCREQTPPALKLDPHVGAVGMRFLSGDRWPEEYRGQIILAEHGSWNRSEKSGYRLMHVRVEGTEATSYEAFVEGWLQGGKAWGRPVDVLELEDGSLLVSDDMQGALYRIRYEG